MNHLCKCGRPAVGYRNLRWWCRLCAPIGLLMDLDRPKGRGRRRPTQRA